MSAWDLAENNFTLLNDENPNDAVDGGGDCTEPNLPNLVWNIILTTRPIRVHVARRIQNAIKLTGFPNRNIHDSFARTNWLHVVAVDAPGPNTIVSRPFRVGPFGELIRVSDEDTQTLVVNGSPKVVQTFRQELTAATPTIMMGEDLPS